MNHFLQTTQNALLSIVCYQLTHILNANYRLLQKGILLLAFILVSCKPWGIIGDTGSREQAIKQVEAYKTVEVLEPIQLKSHLDTLPRALQRAQLPLLETAARLEKLDLSQEYQEYKAYLKLSAWGEYPYHATSVPAVTSPKFVSFKLRMALAKGDYTRAKSILLTVSDTFASTFLHEVVAGERLQPIEFLLDNLPEGIVNAQDAKGYSPLHYACKAGNLGIVQLLVAKGAHINLKDRSKNTPLHYACKSGNLEIVRCLVDKGAHINLKNLCGDIPLHYACKAGHLGIVQFLVGKCDDVTMLRLKSYTGNTPFYAACESGNLEVMQLLMDQGVDIGIEYHIRKTLLHCACRAGNLAIVQLLVAKGADICLEDYMRNTPLHCACESGNLGIVQLLVAKGANINIKDRSGNAPLHYAYKSGNLGIVQLLVDKGANLNTKDYVETTLLHYACKYGNLEMVQFLVAKGADIDIQGTGGNTPLHMAVVSSPYEHNDVKRGKEVVAKFLINAGANLLLRNNFKKAPLHYACKFGKLALVQLLVAKGAEIDMESMGGNTPLHMAVTRSPYDEHEVKLGKEMVAKFLIHEGANLFLLNKLEEVPFGIMAECCSLDLIEDSIVAIESNSGRSLSYICKKLGKHFLFEPSLLKIILDYGDVGYKDIHYEGIAYRDINYKAGTSGYINDSYIKYGYIDKRGAEAYRIVPCGLQAIAEKCKARGFERTAKRIAALVGESSKKGRSES